MLTDLRETYKSIENRQAALRESASGVGAFDEMGREISDSDDVLVQLHGEKKVIEMVESMWKPGKLKAYREGYRQAKRSGKVREALAVSAFPALLRLGVQDLISKKIMTVPTIGDKVRQTVSSNAYIQPYSGTFRAGVPTRVGAGDEFTEVNVQGFGQLVENWKFGEILSYQQELLDDDQTGELQKKVSDLAVNMANYKEVVFTAILSDTSITAGGMTFAPPTYSDPDGTTGVYQSSGNRQNRPATFGAINVNTLKFAKQTLLLMKQPDGQFINITPNTVVYQPVDEQFVEILFKSPTFPATGQTASSTYGGQTGYPAQGVINPVQGAYTPYQDRYLPSNTSTNGGAWYVTEAQAPHVTWQERTGVRVVQEAPNSGVSFSRQLVRWRVDERGAGFMYVGGARFVFQGNNGA